MSICKFLIFFSCHGRALACESEGTYCSASVDLWFPSSKLTPILLFSECVTVSRMSMTVPIPMSMTEG